MKPHVPSRLGLCALGALLLAAVPLVAQPKQPVRRGPAVIAQNPPPEREEHLQRWMESHSRMSLAEQQRALQNEPGFRELPAPVQQNRLRMLERLYNMNPQQRDRILERNEALERMSPPERQQYRSAVQNFATMSPDRRRLMARAIIDLRTMPPDQRQAIVNSDRFRGQFSDFERSTMANLLAAEPYASAPPQ